jgi:hypothetical protein
MAGLVPAIHVFLPAIPLRCGCPAQGMTKHFSPVRSLWMRRDVGLTQAVSLPTVIFKDAVRG